MLELDWYGWPFSRQQLTDSMIRSERVSSYRLNRIVYVRFKMSQKPRVIWCSELTDAEDFTDSAKSKLPNYVELIELKPTVVL